MPLKKLNQPLPFSNHYPPKKIYGIFQLISWMKFSAVSMVMPTFWALLQIYFFYSKLSLFGK